jgi:predicted ATPase
VSQNKQAKRNDMKVDAKITNLGKLKDGLIKIRPMTVLAGKNGTGKSFVTKLLYSIFNVINKNVYHINLRKDISNCKLRLDTFSSNLSYPGQNDSINLRALNKMLDKLAMMLGQAAEELELSAYLSYSKSISTSADDIMIQFNEYINSLDDKPTKKSSVSSDINSIRTALNKIKEKLENGNVTYSNLLQEGLSDEIKENFQISDISRLINFDSKSSTIDINEFAHIELKGSYIDFSLQHEFINIASSLSKVVFFESPAYWKVRDALRAAKENSSFPFYLGRNVQKLTGVPKYFYDLDNALTEHIKNPHPTELEEITRHLENELGGEFIFKGDELVFKDNESNKEINKNLISFGMTNIGMIHSLLKNNIISKGSFVFIDEPETNLHPEWQVLLMNTLVKLAKNNINIVIATHSIDMLKALETNLEDNKDLISDDFLSIHYFDIDGTLLKFDSKNIDGQLIEARDELSSPYQALFFRK